MKQLYVIFIILLLSSFDGFGQSIIELEPSQSMSITGKGPGQDAAINPYSNTDSYGIIENIGKNDFTIRIQEMGEITRLITIKPNETKRITLLEGYELYFDSELKSKASLEFSKIE